MHVVDSAMRSLLVPTYARVSHSHGSVRAGFVERYSLVRQTWEKCPHMIEQRDSHGAAAVGGKLYAFSGGGVDSNLGTCECMEPGTHQWRYVGG